MSSDPKPGISAMRAFTPGTDAWGPFAAWLGGAGTFTWQIAPDLTGAVNSVSLTGSSLVANLESGVPASADQLSPNVLPCHCEQFNAVASLVAAQPPATLNVPPQGNATFTLNFAAANILIVYGGSGHAVGDALNFNLQVAAVDANGAITAVSQNGPVVVNSYDAYATPLRPFDLDGAGATCDTASGDGSTLSFLPTYAPIGVQVPAACVSPAFYGVTDIFPRNAFFAWNGATSGGADPVGDYLASLAGGVTVEDTLPDSYGNPIAAQNTFWFAGSIYNGDPRFAGVGYSGNFTGPIATPGYATGFDPSFQITAQTYRYLTIDTARTIFQYYSLPFQLNEQLLPLSFQTINGSLSAVATTTSSFPALSPGAVQAPTEAYTTCPDETSLLAYYSAHGINVSDYLVLPADGTSGDVCFMQSGREAFFINDANGNWAAAVPNAQLVSQTDHGLISLGQWKVGFQTVFGQSVNHYYWCAGYEVNRFGPFDFTAGGSQFYNQISGGAWEERDYAVSSTVTQFTLEGKMDWGAANAQMRPDLVVRKIAAVTFLREGLPDLCVAALPQNLAYYDLASGNANYDAVLALGTQIVPVIADNTIESAVSEATVVPGAGGADKYDHVFTTQLLNARVVSCPIDGHIAPPITHSAGETTLGAADASASANATL